MWFSSVHSRYNADSTANSLCFTCKYCRCTVLVSKLGMCCVISSKLSGLQQQIPAQLRSFSVGSLCANEQACSQSCSPLAGSHPGREDLVHHPIAVERCNATVSVKTSREQTIGSRLRRELDLIKKRDKLQLRAFPWCSRLEKDKYITRWNRYFIDSLRYIVLI